MVQQKLDQTASFAVSRAKVAVEDAIRQYATKRERKDMADRVAIPLPAAPLLRKANHDAELAAEPQVRLSSITGAIDQLEETRLVELADHPFDNRVVGNWPSCCEQILIAPVATGAALRGAASSQIHDTFGKVEGYEVPRQKS